MNKKSVQILLMLAMLTGLFGSGCGKSTTAALPPDAQGSTPTNTPVTVVMGYSLLIPMDPDNLIHAAELIVIGQVETVYPSRWDTPDGQLPEGMTIHNMKVPPDKPKPWLFTDVEVRIDQMLKGNLDQDRVRVRAFAGEYDGFRLFMFPHAPLLELGQTYLLLLSRCPECLAAHIGPEHYRIWEVFTISDGRAIPLVRPEYEVPVNALVDYIHMTVPFLLQMPEGNPFLVGEKVTLEEAQTEFGVEIPLPAGMEVREVWAAKPYTLAVAIRFDNGLLLIIKKWSDAPPDLESMMNSTPGLKKVEIMGYPGVGIDPGVIKKNEREYSHPGHVMLKLHDRITIALYSDALSLEALLNIARTMPLRALTETTILIPSDTPTDTPIPIPTDTPTDTPIPIPTDTPTDTPTE